VQHTKLLSFLVLFTITATLTVSPSFSAFAQGPDSQGKSDIVVAFGKVPGQDLYAHVWVVVPHGSDKAQTVNQSLQNHGLKQVSHSDFSTTGMVHDQFTNGPTTEKFVQNYNPAGEPVPAKSILQSTQNQWTNVPNSNFAFSDTVNITDRCPSLVKECPGRQVTDNHNDVAWMSIKDRNTLGVTWYNTSSDEADMALNTNFSWNPTEGGFDIETVYLHENGHVLGLGHSEEVGSIMEAVYAGPRPTLTQDDWCGIQTLYGIPDAACTTTTEPPTDPEAGDATTANVDYKIKKGKNGGLQITVTLTDDVSQPVSDTSVTVELFRNGNFVGTATADNTNNEGKANFILQNPVHSGTYNTVVLQIGGADWTGTTIDPTFTK
jgi:hypothetical protein